jgi:Spy/CpxP family protein refolding chaperone
MDMDKQRATWLLIACTLLLLLFSGSIVLAYGQEQAPAPPPPSGSNPPSSSSDGAQKRYQPRPDDRGRGRMPSRFRGQGLSDMSRGVGFRLGPPGRWWNNPQLASKLALTAEQQKKMDDIFQQSRLSLIDLVAAVQKQELIMQPLLDADQPDEAKIIAQIDRVAQARADLEKSNARMLLGLRRVLTPDQWKKLQDARRAMDRPRGGFDGRGGPGGWSGGPGGRPGGDGPPPPGY